MPRFAVPGATKLGAAFRRALVFWARWCSGRVGVLGALVRLSGQKPLRANRAVRFGERRGEVRFMSGISVFSSRVSLASLWAAGAGALGGLLSFPVGEIVGNLTDANAGAPVENILQLVVSSAWWSGAIGLVVGAAILIYDNARSLRGQWHRDLPLGLPLFFALSFGGGAAGQIAYSVVQNSLTRGLGWALMGASIGAGVGILRRDTLQMARGAAGGALGGFIGGFIFDALTLVSDAGNGSFSRLVGQVIMGALIALLMRVVQDALKGAWLLGISTGPYEGKEYPLNTARVSVGREDSNAIALFREPDLPARMGELVFQNGGWCWQGQSTPLNGVPQTNAPLHPGDTIQLGVTRFRFQTRSAKASQTSQASQTFAAPPWTPDVSPAPPLAPASPLAPALQTAPTQMEPVARAQTVAPPPAFGLMALSGQLLRLPTLDAPVAIGRAADNALVLSDATVSSRHARLSWEGGALQLADVGSTNGTWVNGARLAPHAPRRLSVGDRVRFGQLDFTVRAL